MRCARGIPFAIAGGLIALAVTGLAFSVSAAIGFVSLFGVAVMNGILMITYFNEVRHHGGTLVESMHHAATQRMRPMLMTALSACIGLFPAALSHGIGSQVQRPLAVVIVGGMGSIMGSILTGLGLGVIEGLTKVFYPEFSSTVVFLVMVVVLLLRPAGLFGKEK